MWSAVRLPGLRLCPLKAWARRRAEVLAEIAAVRLPLRRRRVNPRAVKRKMSTWPRKRGRPRLPAWNAPVILTKYMVLGLTPASLSSGRGPL